MNASTGGRKRGPGVIDFIAMFTIVFFSSIAFISISWFLFFRLRESDLVSTSIDKMSYRAPLVVPALKKHTATVIMAHGLGDRFVLFLPPSQLLRKIDIILTHNQIVEPAGME